MKKVKPVVITYHVIWLRSGQCVTGFSYPPQIHTGGTSHYPKPKENEIAFSEGCYAVLGNERPYEFLSQDRAEFVASAIPGARVELWSND